MPLLLSLAMHAAPIILLVLLSGGGGGGEEPLQIIPKASNSIEETEIGIDPGKRKTKHEDLKCATYFGGIGITQDVDGTIINTYKGYPAHDAGLRAGDVILTNNDQIKGEIGTEIVLKVASNNTGYITEYVLVRDKICTSPVEE